MIIEGRVILITNSTTEKEGRNGERKEDCKKKITIQGVGDHETKKITLEAEPSTLAEYTFGAPVVIRIQVDQPQTRLTDPPRQRRPVGEESD